MELETDINKLNECAQLCVSINTDDKGVFSTSLENEYSLIARSLEEMKKEDGTLMYNREQIYNWINKIRKMGNLQSFMNNSKDDIGDSRNDKNT
jgi:adenosine deaminase